MKKKSSPWGWRIAGALVGASIFEAWVARYGFTQAAATLALLIAGWMFLWWHQRRAR